MADKPSPKRDSPSYVSMGIEKEFLLRMSRPLKSELKVLHHEFSKALPESSLGQFIAFCASLGMDVIRDKYLPALRDLPARKKKTR